MIKSVVVFIIFLISFVFLFITKTDLGFIASASAMCASAFGTVALMIQKIRDSH